MGSKENFEATSPADGLRDSQPSNLATYSMERDEVVPSLQAIQRQSLVDKGFLPSLDLDGSNGSVILLPCPEDPGFDLWRGREMPDCDPGFAPWGPRPGADTRLAPPKGALPDDSGFDGWKKPDLPPISPEEWKQILAKASVPEVTKQEIATAETAVDKKADMTNAIAALSRLGAPLSDKEQGERKRLDHAILEGNVKEIETILQAHKDDPAALSRVLAAVNEDLREAGIQLSWQTGNMMMGNDEDFHPVGYLKIYQQGMDKAVSFSTDERIGTTVGGPVKWDKDGQAIDLEMGLSGDANRALKDIGSSAVRALTKKK